MRLGLRATCGLWLVLLACVGTITAADDTPATKAADGADMVCGPRCVKFILHHYGQEVELVDLVKQIQWPDLEAGASLDQVQKGLTSRGIHTAAIRIAPDRPLTWPHPAILFIKGADTPQGHYVVKVPGESAEADALIWTGLGGWRRGPWDEVTRGFIGVALLTSPDPIPDAGLSVGSVSNYRLIWLTALSAAVALLTHALYRWFARRRLGTVVPSQ